MSERRTLAAGTAANVIGLGAGVAAALGVQVLLGRALPHGGFGLVTVAVQVAFVASAGSRFGMDMVAVRLVAIGRGAGAVASLRSLVDRCAFAAFAASVVLAGFIAAPAEAARKSAAANVNVRRARPGVREEVLGVRTISRMRGGRRPSPCSGQYGVDLKSPFRRLYDFAGGCSRSGLAANATIVARCSCHACE